jgi:hypothetical protein
LWNDEVEINEIFSLELEANNEKVLSVDFGASSIYGLNSLMAKINPSASNSTDELC